MDRSDQIDAGYKEFLKIIDDVAALQKSEWSEADTRLKVIDRVLFDALGWSKLKASCESQSGTGYADYVLRQSGCAKLVVEAKKEFRSFDLENRQSGKAYNLNGCCLQCHSQRSNKSSNYIYCIQRKRTCLCY